VDEDEKGVTCDEHGNGGNCIQILVPKLKKGDHMEDLDGNGEIILKLILNKLGGRTWPVFP
jgi:hypothetical protein